MEGARKIGFEQALRRMGAAADRTGLSGDLLKIADGK